jgi:transcriptional regulator with XRE-family HTH domain
MTRLGKEIKKARIEKDFSQQTVELMTGIPFRHVSAIERGEVDPRWSTLVKLSMALDLNLDAIALQTDRERQEEPVRGSR